jgi:spermidine/putrescine transport system permease protein
MDRAALVDARSGAEVPAGAPRRVLAWFREAGVWWSVPLVLFFLVAFAGPLVVVALFAFTRPRSFQLAEGLTGDNFRTILEQGYVSTYVTSLLFAALAVVITLAISYPLARGLVRVFHPRLAVLITILVILPLFVAENIRLLGWTMILGKRGFLDGSLQALFGAETGTLLYNKPVIVFGLVYTHLPFMLFPLVVALASIPNDVVHAGRDLGARWWHVISEIEVPLAKPGIIIGALLTFTLSVGAIAEALVLGGQDVVVIGAEIERAFGVQQNWPLGSALSLVLIVIAGLAAWLGMRRIDLDHFLGGRKT